MGAHGEIYRYPKEHWIHLRTTNPIESPFAAVRPLAIGEQIADRVIAQLG